MDQILVDIPGVVCYIDNILIRGVSMSECVSRAILVLSRLEKHNVRLRLDKCSWFVTQLEFLGFVISNGLRSPNPKLVSAITDFGIPRDVKQLESFLGMINFYSEFLPQFSTIANPLRALTSADKFVWSETAQKAFDECKDLLKSSQLLMLYDPSLPIVVCTDASPVGVGAVLNHVIEFNGKLVERPVMFASGTLTAAQKNYA
jgi:hypothetical protein